MVSLAQPVWFRHKYYQHSTEDIVPYLNSTLCLRRCRSLSLSHQLSLTLRISSNKKKGAAMRPGCTHRTVPQCAADVAQCILKIERAHGRSPPPAPFFTLRRAALRPPDKQHACPENCGLGALQSNASTLCASSAANSSATRSFTER